MLLKLNNTHALQIIENIHYVFFSVFCLELIKYGRHSVKFKRNFVKAVKYNNTYGTQDFRLGLFLFHNSGRTDVIRSASKPSFNKIIQPKTKIKNKRQQSNTYSKAHTTYL